MAVSKKTSASKATPKKAVAKKVATPKNVKSTSLVIKIPQGGQVIRSFNLTPSLPVDGKAANWLLVDPAKPTQDIDSMSFSFSVKSSSLEQEFERAIIEINLLQNSNDKGVWRFASDGVFTDPGFGDTSHNIAVEIINQGFTLIAQVQCVDGSESDIRFGYLASFTDAISGAVNIYESQDPDVRVGRP